MRRITLRIKPLQPLMLRGPGEFDPSSRGVFTHAVSLRIPRPSTIVGLLSFTAIAMNLVKIANSVDSWSKLIKYYENIFQALGIEAIRGPYFYNTVNDKVYIPILLGRELLIVGYDEVRHYLCKWRGDIVGKYLSGSIDRSLLEDFREIIRELKTKAELKIRVDRRVGIGLKTRATDEYLPVKTVKRGLIYEASFTSYPRDIEIRVKLIVRDHSVLAGALTTSKNPIRFGGEHRITLVTISNKHDGYDEVVEKVYKNGFRYAILLSPTPIRVEDIKQIKYIGRYDVIGFGYSEIVKRRKPIHQALLEGTIIPVPRKNISLSDMLKYGLYSLLNLNTRDDAYKAYATLGYGSFIPLP